MATDIPTDFDDRPSKSQLKREMHALQALGEKIIELSPSQRARLPLSDDMLAAVDETSRIHSHEARRRHMQYVGKVMRKEDLEAIKATFEEFEQEKLNRDLHFHRLEQWRDRLVAEGDSAVAELLEQYPDVDRQTLRQLIRNAQRERDAGKPPTSSRKLFKFLRDSSGL
ncbi:ribosome biogenesis factor YjgA [Phytohalomonas tamaricis]|uniref:ribosome biogenesis factor YjgA n=1 Tax=Phytohalomonas tamaricis TaxID=2081032 RepID=UPI000D0BA834|nr:ribosome biogenesis factor YjgA [Phytohalomonas tamaricis]